MEKRIDMEKNSGAKQLYEQKISYLQGQIERAEAEIKEKAEAEKYAENTIQITMIISFNKAEGSMIFCF